MAGNEGIIIAKKYIKLLTELGIDIQKAYLYGSFARNQSDENSDIDILLITDKENTENMQLKIKIWQLTRKVDNRIEPKIISRKRFDTDEVSPVLEMIRREGLEISI